MKPRNHRLALAGLALTVALVGAGGIGGPNQAEPAQAAIQSYSLVADTLTGKLWLDQDGNLSASAGDVVYTGQAGKWSFDGSTLTLNGFTWETSAGVALYIHNYPGRPVTIKVTGTNVLRAAVSNPAASNDRALMIQDAVTFTGTGSLAVTLEPVNGIGVALMAREAVLVDGPTITVTAKPGTYGVIWGFEALAGLTVMRGKVTVTAQGAANGNQALMAYGGISVLWGQVVAVASGGARNLALYLDPDYYDFRALGGHYKYRVNRTGPAAPSTWTEVPGGAAFKGFNTTEDSGYVEIVGLGPTHPYFTLSPDLDTDGRGELLAVHYSGSLLRYPGLAGGKLGAAHELVSKGFEGQRVFGPGDWDGDKAADVVHVDTAGNMWLRRGGRNGAVGLPVQIGRGWSAYRIIPAGDLNADGANDMLAIDAAGLLWLYKGNGKGAFQPGRVQVGKGWSGFECFAAADLNKDRKADILGLRADGKLFAYLGRGDGTFGAATQVGQGWGAFSLAAGGDLDGDGLADIVGRNDTTGTLYFYRSKGGGHFQAAVQIATSF